MHPTSRTRRARRGITAGLLALTTVTATACGVSRQQEIELGRQYAAQVNRELPIVEDAYIHRYVNLLGSSIARQGERNLDYTFYVVNTEAVNAFALPGGFVYVNRGLIEETDNLAELAGVLAHEIAHVEERHSAEQIERAQRANVGLLVASVLLGPPGGLTRAAVEVGGAALFASYSRDAEAEADQVAVPLLVSAGIDPNGMVTFFMELLQQRERQPSTVEQWFATHPLTEERIAGTRERIRTVPQTQLERLTVNTDQFEAFQRRVGQLPEPSS